MLKSRLSGLGSVVLIPALLFLCACNNPGEPTQVVVTEPPHSVPTDTSSTDPVNPDPVIPDPAIPDPSPTPTAPPVGRTYATDVLLFNGTGISTSDWQSTEDLVKSQGWSYRLVNSAQLNVMSLDEISDFGLMIVPGGNGASITSGLTSATRIKVRQAVRERGVSYIGFCAGAWVAVGPEPATGKAASYGFALVTGPLLPAYYPNNQSPTAAMVDVSLSDGSDRYLVWWGGPSTPEWKDGVIGRYKTGDPAISETWAGKGLVIITGPHPEAPQGWRATAGNDPDGLDYDLAIKLMNAALKQEPLPSI